MKKTLATSDRSDRGNQPMSQHKRPGFIEKPGLCRVNNSLRTRGYFTRPAARILLALPAWPKAIMRATQISFMAARAGFM